jgi:hypothetical protein
MTIGYLQFNCNFVQSWHILSSSDKFGTRTRKNHNFIQRNQHKIPHSCCWTYATFGLLKAGQTLWKLMGRKVPVHMRFQKPGLVQHRPCGHSHVHNTPFSQSCGGLRHVSAVALYQAFLIGADTVCGENIQLNSGCGRRNRRAFSITLYQCSF